MDLIRLILLRVESGDNVAAIPDYAESAILYHGSLAIEAGLLDGEVIQGESGVIVSAIIRKLTWAGHDFLDSARDEGTWLKATQRVAKAGGSWTFDLLKQVLTEIVKTSLFPPS